MTVWITSDTHFAHEKVLTWSHRPFASIAAHDDALLGNWNDVVRPSDTVWHLGDFSVGPHGTAERYFHRLNGRKHLVRGNHDGADVLSCGWESVHDIENLDYTLIDVGTQRSKGIQVVLCHYPMLSWLGSGQNIDGEVRSIHCHGHVHGTKACPRVPHLDACRVDIGVDMMSMAPVAIEDVISRVVSITHRGR